MNPDEKLVYKGAKRDYPQKLGFNYSVLQIYSVCFQDRGRFFVLTERQSQKTQNRPLSCNFHVEDYHTYYVAGKGILVHNTCGGRELSNSELRSFGKPGDNQGYRVTEGSHADAMNFVSSQTNGLTEYAPGKFVGYNSQGVEFRVYPRDGYNYSSIRISGVEGLKGIKFLWA